MTWVVAPVATLVVVIFVGVLAASFQVQAATLEGLLVATLVVLLAATSEAFLAVTWEAFLAVTSEAYQVAKQVVRLALEVPSPWVVEIAST